MYVIDIWNVRFNSGDNGFNILMDNLSDLLNHHIKYYIIIL